MRTIKLISVAKSRVLEVRASQGGLSFETMMENAGRATADAIRTRAPVQGRCVVVLVGPGNNGGDGLVAAHFLHEMGAQVACYVWRRDVAADDNYGRVERDGIARVWARDDADGRALEGLVLSADVVVDALLGVGVARPISGDLEQLLDRVRRAASTAPKAAGLVETVPASRQDAGRIVVAVDCPTGLDCDTGAADPAALPANLTVTFAYPKLGLLRFPGAALVGDLVVADIGIPAALAEDIDLELASAGRVCSWLPKRFRDGHKGTFGSLLVVAGSVNYTGAAVLAGQAATRVGTGLVTLALPASIHSPVAASLKEATYLLLPHDLGVLARGGVEVLDKHVADYEALLVGPGLTQEPETCAFVHDFLGLGGIEGTARLGFVSSSARRQSRQAALPPLVIDADALNALAQADRWWEALPPGTILTPHPGEMARLVGGGQTARGVQKEREAVCLEMAKKWGAVVVLKGAFSVVAAADGRETVIPFANPGLATAGSGDVLAGAIAGLRAQGMGAFEAAVAGAYVHGLAGELVRQELGDMGMVAGDLPQRLPQALRRIRGR